VLDARPGSALQLVSTSLDCTGGLPCTLGELAPGAVKTVIAEFAFTAGVPREAPVEFHIAAGNPAPAAADAVTTAVATRASGCSSAGRGSGGLLALLMVAGFLGRRRPSDAR